MKLLPPIIPRNIHWAIFPFTGLFIGWYLDNQETERLAIFRDKSALYGRALKNGEKPSWP